MMTPETFDQLFECYLAGELTQTDGKRLKACLEDAEWQARWRALSDLEGGLANEFSTRRAMDPGPRERPSGRKRRPRTTALMRAKGRRPVAAAVWISAAAAAAVAVVVILAAGLANRPREEKRAAKSAARPPVHAPPSHRETSTLADPDESPARPDPASRRPATCSYIPAPTRIPRTGLVYVSA